MIAGLDCGRCHVPGQEEQSGKPKHAVDEGRDAFIKANAPLHPSPVDIAANMAVQVSAQGVKHAKSSCQSSKEPNSRSQASTGPSYRAPLAHARGRSVARGPWGCTL